MRAYVSPPYILVIRKYKNRSYSGCGLRDQMNDSAGLEDGRSPPAKKAAMAYFEVQINII